jgi:hypothetical protein
MNLAHHPHAAACNTCYIVCPSTCCQLLSVRCLLVSPPPLHWLFSAAAASSGLESASYARADALSNHMGLFLQKTNIIRDYLVRDRWGGGGTATGRELRAAAVTCQHLCCWRRVFVLFGMLLLGPLCGVDAPSRVRSCCSSAAHR